MRQKAQEIGRITLLATIVATAFGIAHDLFSVSVYEPWLRDCHYYTGLRGIPLALYWGVVATWWVGALAGAGLGLIATVGPQPVITWRQIRRPMLLGSCILLLVAILFWCGLGMFAQGAREEIVAKHGAEEFSQRWRGVATASMHLFSYFGSVVLALVLAIWVSVKRSRLSEVPGPGTSA